MTARHQPTRLDRLFVRIDSATDALSSALKVLDLTGPGTLNRRQLARLRRRMVNVERLARRLGAQTAIAGGAP